MKHVLVAAVVAAALAVPGVAAAQGTVTITLTQDGQDLANALGISVTQLQQDTEDAIAEAYDVNRVDDFLRAFADATSFSNRGIGVDYAANADGLMLGVSGNVAVAVGDLGQDEAGADHPVAGVAPNLALMGGLNFSRWDLPQLTIYGNAFYRSGSLDKLTGSITSVFFALSIDGRIRYFHAYCDMSAKGSAARLRDVIIERESRPVRAMTRTERLDHIWSTTHADYRGYAGERWPERDRGARTITVYGGPQGTVLKLLDDLTEAQISAKLPVHLRYLPAAIAA